MLRNFTDYVTTPISFPECCETLRITQQCLFWPLECCRTLRIAQQRFLSTSGMPRNLTDYLTMGVKYFKAVKQRLQAIKQWSSDEIRVWHSIYYHRWILWVCLFWLNWLGFWIWYNDSWSMWCFIYFSLCFQVFGFDI